MEAHSLLGVSSAKTLLCLLPPFSPLGACTSWTGLGHMSDPTWCDPAALEAANIWQDKPGIVAREWDAPL